jgi:NTE family protein
MSREQTGICLSGGGARGIAHIGVLRALLEHGLRPGIVSGASAGAIVGALYAAGKTPEEMLAIFKDSSLLRLFRLAVPTGGLADNGYIAELLRGILPADDFSALQVPLYVALTNLSQGRLEIHSGGPLSEVVAASAAIPLLFKPRRIGEDYYVDGGVLANLPVAPLREACRHLIGVNVNPVRPAGPPENLLEVGYRTFDLVLWGNVGPQLPFCDTLIEPETSSYGLFDLHKADEICALGYEAALRQMPALLRALGQEPVALKLPPHRPSLAMPPARPSLRQRLRAWWQRLLGRMRRGAGRR